jgi:hypothetical protein
MSWYRSPALQPLLAITNVYAHENRGAALLLQHRLQIDTANSYLIDIAGMQVPFLIGTCSIPPVTMYTRGK